MPFTFLKITEWKNDRNYSTTLIEQTHKKWKILQLCAYLMGIFGLSLISFQIWDSVYKPLALSSHNLGLSPLMGFGDLFANFFGFLGCLFLALSLITGSYAKFMAWWKHG